MMHAQMAFIGPSFVLIFDGSDNPVDLVIDASI